ncbi:hypothetical protein ANN_05898 [Periplaneta americana]|uniref:DDE-1 domain-containing protein n=1 Tax=Periplaneta americana TaxID=6978 RepID=A0ABQ8TDV1_PERAM|nr:hypothetical protein ANN_05898 [Periplaneta americana]
MAGLCEGGNEPSGFLKAIWIVRVPQTMFTKLEQRSCIKIEVARGRSAQECFQGLREAPPLRLALKRKRRHLVIQNPIILFDNARSHIDAVAKDLLRHWQWKIL